MEEGKKTCCCQKKKNFVTGFIQSPHGAVPQVSASLTRDDCLGILLARLTFNRMDYKVEPGLYALGNPGPGSPVLVTANYKLTFDTVRSSVGSLDAWIMVLDTKGINVWCAAGKGTFGTREMIERIKKTGLAGIVTSRTVMVPQLGAPGVAGHLVQKETGFRVVFGPVRAWALPAFLKNNMQATPEMRKVHFGFFDRFILVPAEVAFLFPAGLYVIAAFFFLLGFGNGGYSIPLMLHDGRIAAFNLLSAFFAGAVLGPLFLPWLPGRSFAQKGCIAGAAVSLLLLGFGAISGRPLVITAWFLLIPAIASFLTMNFTGASTFTSLSGVRREMRIAVPLQAVFFAAGLVFLIISRFR